MNLQLTDVDIRTVCQELVTAGGKTSGRQLRRALQARYGVVGQTARVFRIWREFTAVTLSGTRVVSVAVQPNDWQQQLDQAHTTADAYRERAELSELREQAHQDRWAMEVDQLRQALREQSQHAATIRRLQEQVLRLTVELHAARRQLAGTPAIE